MEFGGGMGGGNMEPPAWTAVRKAK
jgi:hypothetical protein